MLGLPDSPMQFEEDLGQIRNDISRIREDISLIQQDIGWMSQLGPALMNTLIELRTIRRLMEVHMGEATQEELAGEVEADREELREFERQNKKRMDLRRG
ncbi:MAG: hypothetical protein OXI19_00400 [Gemmatimonadota bacterium]|nr:hypothetical protein [Gemmatimonadota bacterium]